MAAATMSGAWSYAVPLDEVDGNARPAMSRRGTGSSAEHGAAKQLARKNSAWDLQSDSEETRQRRTSVRQSHTQASRKRSRNTLRSDDDPDSPRLDDSKWIHRDKLAQIEIKEMREAGIMVAPQRRSLSAGAARSRSRSRSRGYKPTGQELDDEYAAAYPYDDSPRRRRMSPVFSDDGQPAPELQQPSRYNHQGDGNERSPQKPFQPDQGPLAYQSLELVQCRYRVVLMIELRRISAIDPTVRVWVDRGNSTIGKCGPTARAAR
jgi:hypothetical protein